MTSKDNGRPTYTLTSTWPSSGYWVPSIPWLETSSNSSVIFLWRCDFGDRVLDTIFSSLPLHGKAVISKLPQLFPHSDKLSNNSATFCSVVDSSGLTAAPPSNSPSGGLQKRKIKYLTRICYTQDYRYTYIMIDYAFKKDKWPKVVHIWLWLGLLTNWQVVCHEIF